MSNIAVLHGNGKVFERLRRAVVTDAVAGARHCVERYVEWQHLIERLGGSPASNCRIAVVDAYHGGEFRIAGIKRLREEWPSIPVVVYSDFAGRPAQEPAQLALAGVSRFITFNVDDHPAQIQDALAAIDFGARAECLARLREVADGVTVAIIMQLYEAVGEAMSSRNREAFDRGGGSAIVALGQATIKDRIGDALHRRAVERKLTRLRLPPPVELIEFVRLLHVARLLDDPGRTITNVSETTGFDTTLYRVVKRITGLTPDALRTAGALSTVLRLLSERLRNLP